MESHGAGFRLSNIWLQNFGFLFLATFSALLVTRPIFSAVVFGLLFLLATALALVYRLRTFCNYVCPISEFLSLYAMTSTMELRSVGCVGECALSGCHLAGYCFGKSNVPVRTHMYVVKGKERS